MAKGNDGNYLQHSVEVAAALQLVACCSERRLHIALCHGMAPREPSGQPPPGQTRRLLLAALEAARGPAIPSEPPVVTAYRGTKARLASYPNTGELLAAVLGRNRLSGGITETEPRKYSELLRAWAATEVRVAGSSWRAQVGADGVLTCPASLRLPWLFSADPMTFREQGYTDDDNLYRSDLATLSGTLRAFASSGQPGIAALFVYAVRPDTRPKFWEFVDDLATVAGLVVTPTWIVHQGGNVNLAALLVSPLLPRPTWLPSGVSYGR